MNSIQPIAGSEVSRENAQSESLPIVAAEHARVFEQLLADTVASGEKFQKKLAQGELTTVELLEAQALINDWSYGQKLVATVTQKGAQAVNEVFKSQ